MRVWRLAKEPVRHCVRRSKTVNVGQAPKAAYMTPNGEGAKKYGGRWNPPGLAVVYTSESLALAAFEALVHADSDLLPDDLVIQSAQIPDRLAIRTISPDELPDNW